MSRVLIAPVTVLSGGLFTLRASADTDATATADGSAAQSPTEASAPADSSGGGSSGAPSDSSSGVSIGVAVAINYVRVFNLAVLPIDATVISHGATIQALSGGMDELGASATSGAGGGSVGIAGSVAIDIENIDTEAVMAGVLTAGTGDVAIALSNVTTTATVNSGIPLGIGGAFSATADQSASANTTAEGDAQGKSAAVGVSLALTIANHSTEATLLRNLSAGGAITLAAHGSSDSSATAKASAAGAPEDSSGSAGAPADSTSGGHPGTGVSDQVASQRGFLDTTHSSNGGGASDGGDSTPSSDTSDGGVSVAAAVAINLAKTTSRATLIGAITVNTNGGRFTLSTSADTDAKATADGSAVQPPDASASSSGSSGSGGSGGSGGSSGSSGSG